MSCSSKFFEELIKKDSPAYTLFLTRKTGSGKLLGGKILTLPLYYATLNNVLVANSRRGLFGKKRHRR